MDKDVTAIGVFLVFVFIISMAAHMLYVKGYAFEWAEARMYENAGDAVEVFKTQDDCEHKTGASCVLQLCDEVTSGREFEDVCGQGFKEGWQPKRGH